MSRAAFDTTCDIFSGPGSATPGAFVGTFDCRLVIADAIYLVGGGSPLRLAYLTIAGYSPVPSWVNPPFGADATLADQIAVPSGSAVSWWTVFTESVDWHGQPVYFRANVAPLPLPPIDGILMESSGWVLDEASLIILLE